MLLGDGGYDGDFPRSGSPSPRFPGLDEGVTIEGNLKVASVSYNSVFIV